MPNPGAPPTASLREWVATSRLAGVVRPVYRYLEVPAWYLTGRRSVPPHMFKQKVLRSYARRYRLKTLVETGTYVGDMVWALRRDFATIHSIELSEELYEKARARFSGFEHIHLHHGDSREVLGQVISTLAGPALFWLDGHYSGERTARGPVVTPVMSELAHVFGSDRAHAHVALIDDAWEFTGARGYPAQEELERSLPPDRGLSFSVADNIIRITPPDPLS
ncbi:MAG: hypothetical protein E6J02_00480 [Chloroflexi bacterium]|nr:MAG: hypothetical protein E6J02_00480 [Chloroflexota bacterium]TME15019.1 MAG: hypothetical protein E6I63_11285 [Chloroflexota bacterium]